MSRKMGPAMRTVMVDDELAALVEQEMPLDRPRLPHH